MKNFRTYQYAVSFYRATGRLQVEGHLKNQLLRASSSIVLNLAEGSGRFGRKDQKRFYQIALGSFRECQAILELADATRPELLELADRLGGSLFCLIRRG